MYRNLYHQSNPEDIRAKLPVKWGFHTNRASKLHIINTLTAALETGGYIERDARVCDEMDCYQWTEKGGMAAVSGSHDDLVITTAGAVHIALNEMPPPKEAAPLQTDLPAGRIETASAAVL